MASPTKKPISVSNTRKGTCTHIRASRSYNEASTCTHCGNVGEQGWVYRCTQDYDGQIPFAEAGFTEEEQISLISTIRRRGWPVAGTDLPIHEKHFRAEDNIPDVSSLKPWMIKAMSNGEYTPKQLELLISQRMSAKIVIRHEEMKIRQTEERRMTTQAKAVQRYRFRTSRGIVGLDGQELTEDEMTAEQILGETLESRLEAAKKASWCEYKCCPSCRPIMRDRAWTSLNSIVHPENVFPTEIDCRPIAEVKIVLKMNTDMESDSEAQSSSSQSNTTSDELYARESTSQILRRHSSSFLGNIRRALSDFVNKDHRSRSAEQLSTRSTSSSQKRQKLGHVDDQEDDRAAALSVARPESRIGDSWITDAVSNGNFSQVPPGILRHMHNTSIADVLGTSATKQHISSKTDNAHSTKSNEEVHLVKGVAVTEEAVGLGMADIMTQA